METTKRRKKNEIARPIGNGQRTLDKIIYVYVRLRKNKAKIHLIIAGQT